MTDPLSGNGQVAFRKTKATGEFCIPDFKDGIDQNKNDQRKDGEN